VETVELRDPLVVKAGQTYDEEFEFLDEEGAPIDISDFDFAMHVRERAGGEKLCEAEVTKPDTNKIRIVISAAQTAALKPRSYRCDLRMSKDDIVDYPFEGEFKVLSAITTS
jgi:hypothetical protein